MKLPFNQPKKRQIRTVFFSLIGATFLSSLVYAVPMMTNYQGNLRDASGNPLSASVSMTFSLYDTPEGGTPLWTETHPSVTVTEGVFSVVLGSVINFTAADIEGERYLGVKVGTDEEMLPRHALTSAAFAIRAGVAESVTNLAGHSAMELDDLTSAGSGEIITAEERGKLGDLTSNVPPGHLQVEGSIWLEEHTDPPASIEERLYNQEGELYWNGSLLSSLTETDPTVAEEVKDGVSWSEVSEKPPIISVETDPTVAAEVKDGVSWSEVSDKPEMIIEETDPTVAAEVKDGVSWSEVSDKPTGFDDNVDDVGITSLTGHSATELDDLTSAGSGAIITAEERGKLEELTGSVPPGNLQVEGSILLEEHTDPLSPTEKRLYNQEGELYWNGSQLTAVTETDPTVAAEVKDGVSWSEVTEKPAIISVETDPTLPSNLKDGVSWSEVSDKPTIISVETDPTLPSSLKDGVSWSEVSDKPAIVSSESDPQVGSNTLNYVPKWNGSALINGTIYDNGNVGIGTTSPNTKFEVNGTITTQKLTTRENQQEMITSVGGHDIFKISRTLSDHPDHVGIYERRLELLGPADETPDLGAVSVYGRIHINGDKRHSQNGIGPMIAFHPTFPDSNDNRHLYMSMGDTWNNSGLSRTDFIIHSWNDSWQDHIQHIVFKSNGNVGIGTTSPQGKLDVHGSIIFGGHLVSNYDALILNAGPTTGGDSGIWFRRYHDLTSFGSSYTDLMRVTGEGDVGIGTTSPQGKLDVRGNIYHVGSYITSDQKWKKNITPLENSLEKVSKLQGVNYQWDTENHPEMGFSKETQIGFIAQDVEPVLPELVRTDNKGYKSVSYEKMTAVLVEAVKELKAQNEALKAIVCEDHPEKAICQ